jgi:hypothetical protein
MTISNTFSFTGDSIPITAVSNTFSFVGDFIPTMAISNTLSLTVDGISTLSYLFTSLSPASTHTAIVLLSKKTGIDLTITGTTSLYAPPTGRSAIIDLVVLRCTAAVGITTPAVAGIGVAVGEDDVYNSQPLVGLTAPDEFFVFPPGGAMVELAALDQLKIGVDTAAIGVSQVVAIDVFGREF